MKTRYILMNQSALSLVLIIYTRLYFGMLFWDYISYFSLRFLSTQDYDNETKYGKPKDSKNKHFST